MSLAVEVLTERILDAADWLESQDVDIAEVMKRRDKNEPGRRRKEAAEIRLFKWMQRYFRKQRKEIEELWGGMGGGSQTRPYEIEIINFAKAVGPVLSIFERVFGKKELINELALILYQAVKDGVILFAKDTNIGFDTSLVNPGAIEWARKYAYELVAGIDASTQNSLQAAIASFAETPGMTLKEVMDMLPFDDQRSELVATTEITRAYAEGNMQAGEKLKEEFPGVQVIKRWFTNVDDRVCEICGPLHMEEIELEEMFESNGMEFEGPPAHPGCRCWTTTSTRIGGGGS